MDYTEITNEVILEVMRAKAKHPNFPNDILHKIAIVGEEYGESVRASVQYVYEGGTKEEIKKELIQTCATIFRTLEKL